MSIETADWKFTKAEKNPKKKGQEEKKIKKSWCAVVKEGKIGQSHHAITAKVFTYF